MMKYSTLTHLGNNGVLLFHIIGELQKNTQTVAQVAHSFYRVQKYFIPENLALKIAIDSHNTEITRNKLFKSKPFDRVYASVVRVLSPEG